MLFNKKNLFLGVGLALFAGIFILSPEIAHASTQSTGMPYDSWLQKVERSVTMTIAPCVVLIGLVVAGIKLTLDGGEIGTFVKSLLFLVLVAGLAIGGEAMKQYVFNSGATIGEISQSATMLPSLKPEFLIGNLLVLFFSFAFARQLQEAKK